MKQMIILIIILIGAVIFGCSRADESSSQSSQSSSQSSTPPTVQNENGRLIAVNIHEYGGYDGRDIDWKVYHDNDKYFLDYSDNGTKYFEYYYSLPDRNTIEITEEEYNSIMYVNYDRLIGEYDKEEAESIDDYIYFQSELSYENGYVCSAEANFTEVTLIFTDLLLKYKE